MAAAMPLEIVRRQLFAGGVIPAHPLALTARRRFDERRQRALTRYYLDAGAAGVAIGVHTTQFGIRDPKVGLYRPVLELGSETVDRWPTRQRIIKVAGAIGPTGQAVREAGIAAEYGYDVALLSLGGLADWSDQQLLRHVREVAAVLPIMGFYLQPAVGGRTLGYRFWRRLAEIDRVVAIKVAPFNRYHTLDVVRGVVDAGQHRRIALYTGNDDSIVTDLLARYRLPDPRGRLVTVRFVGGLLGHWAYWTSNAVALVNRIRREPRARSGIDLGPATTDANGAIFDAANQFRGCLPGIHEVLRRQGLLAGRWCLDVTERLSAGQGAEIDRIHASYPGLRDDRFVRQRLSRWLTP